MLTSNIFKRGGPKKESGSVPVKAREKPLDNDPEMEIEHGLDSDEDGEAEISIQELRSVLSAPRTG